MARRKKNQIFEEHVETETAPAEAPAEEHIATSEVQEDTDDNNFSSKLEADLEEDTEEDTKEDANASCNAEDVQCIALENGLQAAEVELRRAQQRIKQLEEENRQLKADNDALLLKLAELSSEKAQQDETSHSQQQNAIQPEERRCTKSSAKQSMGVHYTQMYTNNGYGTWH